MFYKYRKSENTVRVLLIYLLLNNLNISEKMLVEEVEETRMFGLKIRKLYGVTDEVVDVRAIENEIESIQNPVICSPLSYEYYNDSPQIYVHTAHSKDSPLWINDMGVISRYMVMTDSCIISSNSANPVGKCEQGLGFMYFYDYVLKGQTSIGRWKATFQDNVFRIYYSSPEAKGSENMIEELLYEAIEIDRTSTYKMVLYIINKVMPQIEKIQSDNFDVEEYKRVVKD